MNSSADAGSGQFLFWQRGPGVHPRVADGRGMRIRVQSNIFRSRRCVAHLAARAPNMVRPSPAVRPCRRRLPFYDLAKWPPEAPLAALAEVARWTPEWCRWPASPIRTKCSLRDFESGLQRTILPLRRLSGAAVLARYGGSRLIVPSVTRARHVA